MGWMSLLPMLLQQAQNSAQGAKFNGGYNPQQQKPPIGGFSKLLGSMGGGGGAAGGQSFAPGTDLSSYWGT